MSETTDLVKSTIEKVIERVDLLAAKLGIAAGEIWRFSVTAKAVEARAEMAKSAALLLVPVILWGWALHVALNPLPHDVDTFNEYETTQTQPVPCEQVAMVNGKQTVLHETCWNNSQKPVERKRDKGLSTDGGLLLASGVLTAIFGLVVAIFAVGGMIDGFASTKTAEYDAYQELLYDWKD